MDHPISALNPLISDHSLPKKDQAISDSVLAFWLAPTEAYFTQKIIAAVLSKSTKTLECDRWRKTGIPFRKIGGRILYQKRDVVEWIESHARVSNTSQYGRGVSS